MPVHSLARLLSHPCFKPLTPREEGLPVSHRRGAPGRRVTISDSSQSIRMPLAVAAPLPFASLDYS